MSAIPQNLIFAKLDTDLTQHNVYSLQESHLEDDGRLRVEADREGVAVTRVQSKLSNQAAHHELQVREGGDASSNRGGKVEKRGISAEQEILIRERKHICHYHVHYRIAGYFQPDFIFDQRLQVEN